METPLERLLNKTVPQNLQAEQDLICALLFDGTAIERVMEPDCGLTSAMFHGDAHKLIYRTMEYLHKKDKPIDLRTVETVLGQHKKLDQLDGGTTEAGRLYLAQLADGGYSAANVKHYAGFVKECYLRRLWIGYALKVLEGAHEEGVDLKAFEAEAESGAMAIAAHSVKGEWVPLNEIVGEVVALVEEAMRNKSPLHGIKSGLKGLDNLTMGWMKGELIILAARPSVGKTALALQIAEQAAKDKHPVAIFSIEMHRRQLGFRYVQAGLNISAYSLRGGILSDPQNTGLTEQIDKYSVPIFINDSSSMTHTDIRAQTRQAVHKFGVELCIVDYAQLISGPAGESRTREVGIVAHSLKAMAKDLDIPVIAISSLSRNSENAGRKPCLSDLRDSGEVEFEADTVIFIHKDKDGERSIEVAKARNAATGNVPVTWLPEIMRFADKAEDHHTPPPTEALRGSDGYWTDKED